MVWSPPFSSLLISCHLPLCISHSSKAKSPRVPCGHEAFHSPMAMHILLLRREHVFPLSPLICSLLITIQIFAMVPSSKKPFPDNVPLPFQADLFRSTSPRPPYLGCASITAYKRTVPVLVSPARMYYTPLGKKISIPSTSPGLTL